MTSEFCRQLFSQVNRMLKQIASEINFRRGYRGGDIRFLQAAVKQNRFNSRAALELGRRGVGEPICASVLMSLSGLRDFANGHPLSDDSNELLELIARHLQSSRGQSFQDVVALWATGEKRDGYFVEVGTGNGETLSNTYLLEKHFGWRGVVFEPDRRFHESIAASREAILDTRAVYSADDRVCDFMEVGRSGELSTLTHHLGDDGRSRRGQTHQVSTVTLNRALAEHGAPESIDFISIDTEGSELEVLEGLDLNRYHVGLLVIEHNFVAGRKRRLLDHLTPFGYREVFPEFSHQDVWLVRD